VERGSTADGNTIDCLEESAEDEEGGMEGRVLLLVENDSHTWRPPKGTILHAGHQLVLAVSQKGLAHMLSLTNPGPPANNQHSTPTTHKAGLYLPQGGT
jgi:hypothetical protein